MLPMMRARVTSGTPRRTINQPARRRRADSPTVRADARGRAGPSSLVMLNRYPYSNCHLLVAPRKHTATLSRLDADEMLDLFATLRRSVEVLTAAVKPAGFNIGMNLGVTPVTGVTLPFVSYGGSSMIAAWLGIGLLQLVRLSSNPPPRT